MKDSTVSARVETNIKIEAEDILQKLGVPSSVVINSLYRQIIYHKGIPFSLTVPAEPETIDLVDSFEIVITPDAEADLLEIRDYIAYTLLVPDVALDYIRVIRREIEKLSYMTVSIAPIDKEPWHSRGVHKIIAKNFYIYYRLDESSGRVYVMIVIYAKRDQLKALKKIPIDH